MHSEGVIIGIDFGTTNSVVSIIEGDNPVIVPSAEGENRTPSIVAFMENGEVIVGEKARRQAVTNPRRTISSVKRLLGRTFEDLDEAGEVFPFEMVNHDDSLLIDIDGMGYRPEQIGALILKQLKHNAADYCGQPVTKAVITVPAYFDDMQRNSVIESAKLAGLEVLRLINEPTAAAMAYGLGRNADMEETIAIFDFGGGTFDITILEIEEKTFEVLTSTGDSRLGGDDIDNLIVNKLVDEFYKAHGMDLSGDPTTLRRLKEVCEKAKCDLSSATTARISLPFFAMKDGQPIHLERQLSREEFEAMIEPLVNRTIRCCRRALEDAALNKRDISKVVLVGGSTRIPLVQDAVEDFFGIGPFKGVNPDEVVALGAATQAGIFAGNIQEVILLDVTPHSLGIEVTNDKCSKIIEKNSTIPIKAAKTFTTTEPNQTFVNVHILQGEGETASENRSLGKFILSGIPPAAQGVPRIRVTFYINADGVMEISAGDLGSGVEKSLTVLHSTLNEEERSSRKRKRSRNVNSGTRRGALSKKLSGGAAGGKLGEAERPATRLKAPTGESLPPAAVTAAAAPAAAPDHSDSTEAKGQKPPVPAHADSSQAVQKADAAFAVLSDSKAEAGAPPPAAHGIHSVPTQNPDRVDYNSMPTMFTPPAMTGNEPKFTTPLPTRASSPIAATPVPLASRANDTVPDFNNMPTALPIRDLPGPPPPPVNAEETRYMQLASAQTPRPSMDLGTPTPAIMLPQAYLTCVDMLEKDPDSAPAQRAFASALKALQEMPKGTEDTWEVMGAKARVHIALGQLEEARALLREVVSIYVDIYKEQIGEIFEAAMKRFVTSAALRRDRGLYREARGDYAGACDDLEQATRQEPADNDAEVLERLYKARMAAKEDPAAMFKLVKIYLKSNRMDEAVAILQELQRYENYETRAVKILGLCHWQQNLHLLAWQKFKHLKPNDEVKDILYRLAGDMERTDQLQQAIAVYEHLGTADGNYRDVSAKLKKLQFRMKLQAGEEDSQKFSQVLKDSRFTIVEEVNRGSMGIIFKAKDKILDEIVALKVLNDFLCQDPMAVERFKREARAAKKLSHPYIVRIHDMFETGAKRFISMEYIEGTDLKRLQAERTSFTEDMILYYALQICDAIGYAHRLGIVHRDIKPANIMVTKANTIKITDFGIAKILKGDDGTKSGTAVIGTPLYMAPEQITGAGVDTRSDIYSLGIVLYELASGNPPFYLGNIEYHHIHTAPPPLPDRVSAGLKRITLKCMEKEADKRFQTMDEILEELKLLRK
jgi:molecular chaperone DnaK